MILSALPGLQTHSSVRPPAVVRPKVTAHPAEYARVKAFLRVGLLGLDGKPVPLYAKQGEPSVEEDELSEYGVRRYQYRFASVEVFPATDRLAGFSSTLPIEDSVPSHVSDGAGGVRATPRALTDVEAKAIVARFYAASGWPGGTLIREITDLMGGNNACVEVRYDPAWRGVPYEGFEELVDLDRQTGRVESFPFPRWLPEPPASLIPAGTLEQARAVALGAASAWKGIPLREAPGNPLHLVLLHHSPDGPTRFEKLGMARGQVALGFGPRQRAEFAAGRAVLAYSGSVLGEGGEAFPVRIDARTGETLMVGQFESGGLGRSPKPMAKSVTVPTAARSWRIATGAKGWNAWTPPAKVALVPTADPAPTGTKVTLTDGRAAFPATYDPKTGLLGIQGKAYRPGPALAELLRRAR